MYPRLLDLRFEYYSLVGLAPAHPGSWNVLTSQLQSRVLVVLQKYPWQDFPP